MEYVSKEVIIIAFFSIFNNSWLNPTPDLYPYKIAISQSLLKKYVLKGLLASKITPVIASIKWYFLT